ncbi:MAG TPA: glycosyltransferase family 1 protein [Rhodanobacteraceae bacterium]|jgi:glycosyltransferase involved in cell wall biosynthesis|nr:glycosyltransferase family 1 protein [Rhodanobacteraceae bacterium]
MRIAIVTETWPPEINGVALTVQSLALGLAALGHSIEVVRPRQDDDAAAAIQGLDHLPLPGAALPRYPGLRFGLPAHRRLRRRWSAKRPDVLYIATEGPLGLTALGAARRLGIPVSTGFHTRFDDYARHYGFGFLTPIVYAYLRRFHNRADATLVPTAELAAFLEANRFRNVRLLRRAVDTKLFHPARRDEALRGEWRVGEGGLAVIYVGRIAPEKNLDLAVTAFRAIQSHHPSARFVLVGDGPARRTLSAAHPDFIFSGVRRGADLARHYASGDLFLFPSVTETFGNVTLEALASGVPVVAYDYGAAREHMRAADVGACVTLHDRDLFVAAAVVLANDAPRRRRVRESARAAVEGLDPASVASSFAELLGDLARRRAA